MWGYFDNLKFSFSVEYGSTNSLFCFLVHNNTYQQYIVFPEYMKISLDCDIWFVASGGG